MNEDFQIYKKIIPKKHCQAHATLRQCGLNNNQCSMKLILDRCLIYKLHPVELELPTNLQHLTSWPSGGHIQNDVSFLSFIEFIQSDVWFA